MRDMEATSYTTAASNMAASKSVLIALGLCHATRVYAS